MKTFKDITLGLNVRSDKKAGISYADEIVNGNKKYETRNTNSLKHLIGKDVGIVRTGEGKAKAIGHCTIGEPIVVGEKEFRAREHQHLVPKDSQFDIETGGTKYLYPVTNPTRWEDEKDVAHGIVTRRILESKKTFKELMLEVTKVALYTHPETAGADVKDTTSNTKIIKDIPLSKLHANEPESKMKQAGSKQNLKSLVGAIKSGETVPPITAIKHPTIDGHYLVVDGHHRLFAHKNAGSRTIKAEVVPEKHITTIDTKWEG